MKNCAEQRDRYRKRNAGFTLIELLTVIAIIAILASISFAGVSRYLERAKETQTYSNLQNIATGLTGYATRQDNPYGFPPAYGFVKIESRDVAVGALTDGADGDYVLTPYTAFIELHGDEAVAQLPRYLTSYDVNGNGAIDLMEYLPVGSLDSATGTYTFSDTLYTGGNSPMSGGIDEVAQQLNTGRQRPYVYMPFNKRQLQVAKAYWTNNGDEFGENFDIADPDLDGRMFFPPPKYDGCVLIGNGPGGDTGGVVADPPAPVGGGYPAEYEYHVAALRIAFLATRDWDPDGAGPLEPDGLLDFDYQDRQQASLKHITPNGERGFGAFIKVIE